MPVDPIHDLKRALDPAGAFAAAAGLRPDPWQRDVLSGEHRRQLLKCCRQSGKSTICALVALHEAIYNDPALVLTLSPSLRQSNELVRKVKEFHAALDDAPDLALESVTRLEFENGSRVIGLPGSERTTRGYSGAALIILDEASRVDDALISAIKPSQAVVKNGRFIALSTPAGKRGWFYEQWSHGEGWHRVEVTAEQCPRISREFLESERRDLGELQYRQEYLCEFIDDGESVFASELVERAFSDDVRPLFGLG
jgi:hypothetical protein